MCWDLLGHLFCFVRMRWDALSTRIFRRAPNFEEYGFSMALNICLGIFIGFRYLSSLWWPFILSTMKSRDENDRVPGLKLVLFLSF